MAKSESDDAMTALALWIDARRSERPNANADAAVRDIWVTVARRVSLAMGRSIDWMHEVLRTTCPVDAWIPSVDAAHEVLPDLPRIVRVDAHILGDAYELLLAAGSRRERKRSGSFYTPRSVARWVVERTFVRAAELPNVRVLDPAMGAGRFLLESLAYVDARSLHGIDVQPEAVWVARVALTVATGTLDETVTSRLVVGDALSEECPWPCTPDVIVGNPPWVSFAGRQAEPLADETRQDLRARFASFAGFPTMQGMFVERCAARVAPKGRIALLVPTQVADLRGYAATRSSIESRVSIVSPLCDLGFEKFASVVEPTVLLEGERREQDVSVDGAVIWPTTRPAASESDIEPDHAEVGEFVRTLAIAERFDPRAFGELGFQSAGTLSRTHICDLDGTDGLERFSVPMREGRSVTDFFAGPPTCALDPDGVALRKAGTRLRAQEDFARADVLIRQTARYPVAALHEPKLAFRNSLLAGFATESSVMVAILNSRLIRAYHLATQRDGRQGVFPQLKIAHLRALPLPPGGLDQQRLRELSVRAADLQRRRVEHVKGFLTSAGVAMAATRLFEPKSGIIAARWETFRRSTRGSRATLRDAFERCVNDAAEIWEEMSLYLRSADTQSAISSTFE